MVVLHNRMAGIAISLLLLIVFAIPVYAQKNTTYSLNDLVDSLQRHMPLLLQKQAQVNSAKAGVTDAKHAFLPKLMISDEVSIASSNSISGAYLPLGAIPSVSGSIRADNSLQAATGNIASLYGEYELANFGLRGAKVDNAMAYAGVEQADYNKSLYLLKLELGRLYFSLLKNRFQLGVDKENISRNESLYAIISALSESGIKAGVDSLLAKAELSKSRVSYNQRLGLVNQQLQEMAYLTGIPVTQINIDTSAKKYAGPSSNSFVNTNNIENPLLAYYNSQKLLYQSTENLVKKSYLPKILLAVGGWGRGSSIQYNDDYKSLGTGLGYQRFNYAAGVAITYDLFNGVHKKDKLAQSRFQTEASDHALEQQRLWLQNALAQSDERIKVAEKNLVELPYQLQAAAEAYEQKLAQYKAGIINLVDLNNASFVLYTSQTAYIETLNDWFVANLDRSAAGGNLDSFIQTIKR